MKFITKDSLLLPKIILLITFIVLVAIVFLVAQHDMQLRKETVMSQQIANLNNTYKVSMDRFKTAADIFNTTVINREDVLELLYKAKHTTNDNSLIPLRNELFKIVKPYFDDLKKVGVIITLFSFENNKTFLRVHKPDKFNDDLSKVRYSFKYVNENKKIIRGLEEGKIMHAFRNIYPIFYKGEYLGSVDIAFSSTVLKEHMKNLYKTESHFIINKNVFITNIWKMKDIANYAQSIEHEDFLQDKNNNYPDEIEKNFNKKLKKEIYENIKHNNSFAVEDSGQVAAYLAVENIKDKKTIAYLVSYEESDYIKNLINEYILINALSFIILMIIHIMIYIAIKNRYIDKEAKEEEFKNYLDIAQVLIMALDKNKNVMMINQKGADILGYKKEDIIGKNFMENFVPERIRQEISNLGDEIIKEEEIHTEYENHILTKNGKEHLISWKNSKLFDDKGNIVGILTSGVDITDKRASEKRFLEQSKLAQMGEMISMIAHQWRQPISTIAMDANNMLVDIELENFNVTYAKEYANSIAWQTQELSKIIDDFRDFYKPNKQSIVVKLQEVVEKTLNIVKQSLITNNINIIEEYNSDEEIEVYFNEIMHVILNILRNAQENFEEKEIKNKYIKITTGKNTISICENGGGIPEDIIDKIFDPYFSTKDEKNGTGLGLYMSKTIVEEHHNGKLSVENTDDGVCFTIELGKINTYIFL